MFEACANAFTCSLVIFSLNILTIDDSIRSPFNLTSMFIKLLSCIHNFFTRGTVNSIIAILCPSTISASTIHKIFCFSIVLTKFNICCFDCSYRTDVFHKIDILWIIKLSIKYFGSIFRINTRIFIFTGNKIIVIESTWNITIKYKLA